MAKRRLSAAETEELMPVVREFNSLAKQFVKLLGVKNKQKENKINVMVSKIATPDQVKHSVNVVNVGMSKRFVESQRKKAKDKKDGKDSDLAPWKSSQNTWSDDFSKKKGFMI